MKKPLATAAWLLLLASSALAQFTTVTGTVTDPNGLPYAYGTILPLLVTTDTPRFAATTQLYLPPSQASGLNSNGTFTMRLGDNTLLTPANTQWNFTVCSAAGSVPVSWGSGPVCFVLSSPITISEFSQDISTQLNAVAAALTHSGSLNGLLPAGVAAGSACASNGVGKPCVYQSKPVIDVRDAGLVCDGATNDTAALTTLLTAIGSTGSRIRFDSGQCLLSAVTIPVNVSLDFTSGAINVVTGQTVIIKGPIRAAAQQIFFNANASQGTIDLTGNLQADKVFPEWWGASPSASAATNTPAIQAAIIGAYGSARVNGNANLVSNRELHFSGLYNVNGVLNVYHMIGFKWTCSERFTCGLNQQATNTTLFNGQSDAYGVFEDFSWSTTAAQDLAHPLVVIDYSTAQGVDLAPQFIDFQHNLFNGNSLAKTGVQLSPSGGGAQGSNVYFHNNLASNFTEACYMIGNGSGGSASILATNAIAISWFGGDVQGCAAYGIEDFGGGQLKIDATTFENGFNTQTGYDIYASNIPAGETVEIDHVRSEGLFLYGGSAFFVVRNSFVADQAFIPIPGNTPTVGAVIQGSTPGGHGVYWRISAAASGFSGLGTPGTPRTASGGSATTLVDSIGGLTVNAWTGWYVSTIAGTAGGQYCVVTSNTATTFTCSAGWVTDFAGITIGSPDATTTYIVEPAWGTQTTSGGVTWAAITQRIGGGGNTIIDGLFIPGLLVDPSAAQAGSIKNLQVTRGDWWCTNYPTCTNYPLDGVNQTTHYDGVIVGIPAGGPGTGAGKLNSGAGSFRNWSFKRNGITGISNFAVDQKQSVPTCWSAGQAGGGTSTVDICTGGDPNTGTKNGRFYINNNSSGTQHFSYFNADGSVVFPGTVQATTSFFGPTGSASTPVFQTAANTGLFSTGAGVVDITTNSTRNFSFQSIAFYTNQPICDFTNGDSCITFAHGLISTTGAANSPFRASTNLQVGGSDLNMSRDAPGILDVGNGTQGDQSGSIRLASTQITDGSFGSKQTNAASPCETAYGITTLSTGATTTDTGVQCLPTNSIIDAVLYRITTTITTAANFTIGDATTEARFCSTQRTLTAGTTGTCFVQADQTGAAGPRQTAEAGVRVTSNVTPGAGAIRLIVYYHTWTAPKS